MTVQEELFRLKLYRNRMEISEYQQTSLNQTTMVSSKSSSAISYTPEEIQQILHSTAKFTRT